MRLFLWLFVLIGIISLTWLVLVLRLHKTSNAEPLIHDIYINISPLFLSQQIWLHHEYAKNCSMMVAHIQSQHFVFIKFIYENNVLNIADIFENIYMNHDAICGNTSSYLVFDSTLFPKTQFRKSDSRYSDIVSIAVADTLLLYRHICGNFISYKVTEYRTNFVQNLLRFVSSSVNAEYQLDQTTNLGICKDCSLEVDRSFDSVVFLSGYHRRSYRIMNTDFDKKIVQYASIDNIPAPPLRQNKYLDCIPLINTRIYSEKCTPLGEKDKSLIYPLLISGLGGSGSHAISNLLRALHIDVMHESIGSFGAVAWQYAVNDVVIGSQYPHHASLQRLPRISAWVPRFKECIHIVRCPIQQISSITSHLDSSFEFIQAAMRQNHRDDAANTPNEVRNPFCYRSVIINKLSRFIRIDIQEEKL